MSLLRKVQEQRKQIFTIALIVLAAIPLIVLLPRYLQGPRTLPLASGEAPDGNWTTSTWAPANNTLLGTSASPASDVWFTGHNSVVSSVFYPTADTPNSTVLEFLVGNSAHTWVDEEQYDTTAQTRLYNNHALAWRLQLTDNKDYIQHIKPVADYIVAHGPTTPYDQWGENSGYAPETIAAEISGLICAAGIAAINKDTVSQKKYLDTADAYQKTS